MVSILRSTVGLQIPYRRIVFGMSAFDIIGSIAFAFSSLPVPKGEPGVPGAMGNQGTCDAQGFSLNVGEIGSILYMCSLSIYFLCVVNCKMTYQEFRRKPEPFLHILSVCVSIATVGSCLLVGGINPVQQHCSMSAYPSDCLTRDDIECIRGENTFLYYSIGYGIVGVAFCIICGIFLSIALAVVRQEIKNRGYMAFGRNSSSNAEGTGAGGVMARIRLRLSSGHIDGSSHHEDGPLAIALRNRSTITGRASFRRETEAKNQAFLYMFGFFITHIFEIIFHIRRHLGYEDEYIWCLLTAVLSPLQGLTNIIVYTHPHVAALRRSHTDYSWWKAFRITIISGGDHDEMARWRQTRGRRGSTISRMEVNHSSCCHLWAKIKAVFCRRHEQLDSGSSFDGGGDDDGVWAVWDSEHDVENRGNDVDHNDHHRMPNSDATNEDVDHRMPNRSQAEDLACTDVTRKCVSKILQPLQGTRKDEEKQRE